MVDSQLESNPPLFAKSGGFCYTGDMKKVFLGIAILIVIVAAGIFFVKITSPICYAKPYICAKSDNRSDNVYKDLPESHRAISKAPFATLHRRRTTTATPFTYTGVDHPGQEYILEGGTMRTRWTLVRHLHAACVAGRIKYAFCYITKVSHYRSYTATASVQYGRLVDGNVKVSVVPCTRRYHYYICRNRLARSRFLTVCGQFQSIVLG